MNTREVIKKRQHNSLDWYRPRLHSMIFTGTGLKYYANTYSEAELHHVILLENAILSLNFTALERLKKEIAESGVKPTPNSIIERVQKELGQYPDKSK